MTLLEAEAGGTKGIAGVSAIVVGTGPRCYKNVTQISLARGEEIPVD